MIIYAKEIADKIKQDIKSEVAQLIKSYRAPKLVVVLVGDNQASQKYVKAKHNACKELGILSEIVLLDATITTEKLKSEIERLNQDASVDGILVQLPLPKHINELEIIDKIDPNKDVDGFHPLHLGNLLINRDDIVPCTPLGIMAFFEHVNYDLTGKNVVIIGRSNIVSKPLLHLMLAKNATVTITHSKTQNLAQICATADVLVVAIGKPKFVTSEFIKNGAFVVDVGINVDENGKLCGDVDFDNVVDKVSYITPVPKGVGVMTITMLLKNTLKLCKNHLQIKAN